MIDKRTIDLVMERASIVDVVEWSGVELHKSGVNFKGVCPFHDDKDPSLVVSPTKNIAHCFACGEGGNPVNYIMKKEGLSFPAAIKWIAARYHIEVKESDRELSQEDVERQRKRESALVMMQAVAEFYARQLHADTPKAKAALSYVNKRWSHCDPKQKGKDIEKDYPSMMGIGYAPDGWHSLVDFLKQKCFSLAIAEEIGLIRMSDKTHEYYDFYRDRVMLPVRDTYRRVVSFSARTLDKVDQKNPKYINGSDSDIFKKGFTVFGLDIAAKEARRTGKLYMVEGGPDVIQLQSIDINNVVAPLGTAWTTEHFNKLRSLNATLCFIPDTDEVKQGERYGIGIKKVMDSGAEAVRQGFRVTIKEIPPTKDGKKQDADSYIKSRRILDDIEEVDFIEWFAGKLMDASDTTTERARKAKQVCELLTHVEEYYRNALIERLGEDWGGKASWKGSYSEVEREQTRKQAERASKGDDRDLLRKYGFYEEDNCYYAIGRGANHQWSNFTMTPLFHIEDNNNAKRLFKLKNKFGRERLVEFRQEDLTSLPKYKQKIESLGNYLWFGSLLDLDKLKEYLYEETLTAQEIKQLGWQRANNFWAWGNGIIHEGRFKPVNDVGIVGFDLINEDGKKETENFYLPAKSKIYAADNEAFDFERKFVYSDAASSVLLPSLAARMERVFGDNAKIGLAYTLATMFCDVVRTYNGTFPILNLFGPKGSGKTEFASTLMAFFVVNYKPINMQNGTLAGMAQALAQCSNALVHFDEYKNNIDPRSLEILKGAYDGVGRTRMTKDGDKETTKVDSALILSGQEMPTLDIALFSRTIHLSFDTAKHTKTQKDSFDELRNLRLMGLQPLTNQILALRDLVTEKYEAIYKQTLTEMSEDGLEDRVWRSWSAILAMYRLLSKPLQLPWSNDSMTELMRERMMSQNVSCQSRNEMGVFWETFDNMISDGMIYNESDYKLKSVSDLKTDKYPDGWPYESPRLVLMIREKHVIAQYRMAIKKLEAQNMGVDSVKFYLRNLKSYLGKKKGNERFKLIIGGLVQVEERVNAMGMREQKPVSQPDRPMCFDYEKLKEEFNLSLDEPEKDDDIEIF